MARVLSTTVATLGRFHPTPRLSHAATPPIQEVRDPIGFGTGLAGLGGEASLASELVSGVSRKALESVGETTQWLRNSDQQSTMRCDASYITCLNIAYEK